jgi:subtilisin-like proprotein convertase family protein
MGALRGLFLRVTTSDSSNYYPELVDFAGRSRFHASRLFLQRHPDWGCRGAIATTLDTAERSLVMTRTRSRGTGRLAGMGAGVCLAVSSLAMATPPAPPGVAVTSRSVASVEGLVIADRSTAVATLSMPAGSGGVIWGIKVRTDIGHTFPADLDVTLMSPSGTVVTLTTDNGSGNDHVFRGTWWDDDASNELRWPSGTGAPVTEYAFANHTLAAVLSPEEPLGAFRGENPSGTWTLSVADDAAGDAGMLHSWELVIETIPAMPGEAVSYKSADVASPEVLPDFGKLVRQIEISASDLGVDENESPSITGVRCFVDIAHTASGDLDVWLISPGGTTITLSTDNGGVRDDLLGGTWFDDRAGAGAPPGPVTDAGMVNGVALLRVSPEMPLSALIGEDPRGTWLLSVEDDRWGDTGLLRGFALEIRTARADAEPQACGCDFNVSGSLTTQDVFDYLSAWMGREPSADFDRGGDVTVQDLFDYLSCFATGCP